MPLVMLVSSTILIFDIVCFRRLNLISLLFLSEQEYLWADWQNDCQTLICQYLLLTDNQLF